MATTTLFCILLLTTTAMTSCAGILVSLCSLRGLRARALLAQHRLHARQVLARRLHLRGRFELRRGLLQAHLEQLLVELALANPQVLHAQLTELRRLHGHDLHPLLRK